MHEIITFSIMYKGHCWYTEIGLCNDGCGKVHTRVIDTCMKGIFDYQPGQLTLVLAEQALLGDIELLEGPHTLLACSLPVGGTEIERHDY